MAHPSPKLVSRVRDYLLEVSADTGSMEARGLAEDLKRYTKAPKKPLPGVSKSVAKRLKAQTRKEKTSAVREAVMKRADGHCENCGALGSPWRRLDLDHFFSGASKRSRESVETCWALCHRPCHYLKTDNDPSAKYWRDRFRTHLKAKGLPIPGDL